MWFLEQLQQQHAPSGIDSSRKTNAVLLAVVVMAQGRGSASGILLCPHRTFLSPAY